MVSSFGDAGGMKRILTCIQLLTVQTMLMFLMAVFYDLQAPGMLTRPYSFKL